MRIKQHLLPFFVFVAAILCFVLMPPAFSEFRQVNECELARTNASVTGHPIATQCYGLVDEDSDCNPEDAFKACPGMMTEGEALSGEESLWGDLYSSNDEEEDAWLQKAQDFIRIYDPIYNPLSPISVEAGTLANGEPYITIGLGSQEVGLDEMDILVTLGDEAAIAAGQEQVLGSLYLAGLRVKTEGSSYVTLYKKEDHMGLGVNVDAAIERIALDTLSWGDADGIPGDGSTGKAGYVGLKDTSILGVTASGPVELDVQIYDQGVTPGTVGSSTFALVGTKYVHIGLDNLDVGIDSIETTAVIGDKKDFSGDTGVLGTLYLKDLALNVDGRLDLYNETAGDVARLYTDITISTIRDDKDTMLSWGDPDGVPEAPYLGGVGLRNLELTNLHLKGELSIDTATAEAIGGDIADDGILFLDPGTVFVGIGLSNMDISMESMEFDAALGNRKDNLNQVLGSVYLGGLKTVLDGTVKVHTPTVSTQGIVLDLSLAARDNYEPGKPGFRIEVLSWGDTDGIGGTTTAGYIGLRDLDIYGLNIAGRVTIDVATVDSSVPITSKKKLIYLFYDKEHKMGPTFVHIGLGTGDADSIISGPPSLENGQLVVNFDSADFQLAVDNIDTLRFYNRGILGNFYMKNLSIGINGWVDLSAH